MSWAREKRPDLDIPETTDQFRDFWTARPGKDGIKLDWDATYRNWIRNQRAGTGMPSKSARPTWAEGLL